MLTKNALLLPLATTCFMFAKTMSITTPENLPWVSEDFYQNTLLTISLVAMLLLLLHIIKSYRGRRRNSVMLRALLYYVIFVGIILISEHFVGGLFAMGAGVAYMGLLTKRVF